jgi:hypothetical protein
VALGASDLARQPRAEGAAVGQAGQRVGRGLAVQARAVLGVGDGGGDEIGVVLQALLGTGAEALQMVRADHERAPQDGAGVHGRGQAQAPRRLVDLLARERGAGEELREHAAGWRVGDDVDLGVLALVPRPAAEQGEATVVAEAHDRGGVGVEQAARFRGDEGEDAGRRRPRRDRRRDPAQRRVLLGQAPLARAAGDDHAADEEVGRDDDQQLAGEVAHRGVIVVEQQQRVDDGAAQPVGDGLARREEEGRVDDDEPQVVEGG